MKRFLGLVFFILILLAAPATAAEYQGKNIDGRRFIAKAYSYETGGLYNVQVQFKNNRATLYFAGGSQITIRLKHQSITNLSTIEGYSPGPFSLGIGGIFSIGIANSTLGNLQPPHPRPLEGFWRIILQEADLQQDTGPLTKLPS
jgi:hypothetical protein